MPGLLQTEAYARAVLQTGGLLTEEQVERTVSARQERQAILTGKCPPQLVAVLDEAVLRRPVGGRQVIREQLEHLLTTGEQPRVQIHVVPSDVGMHPGLAGAFILATLDGADVAYLESPLRVQEVAKTWT